MIRNLRCEATAGLMMMLLLPLMVAARRKEAVFNWQLEDDRFFCEWSIWEAKSCSNASGDGCVAKVTRRCICVEAPDVTYRQRNCPFGTEQDEEQSPDGHCNAQCKLMDAMFRRLDGINANWCPWSEWNKTNCITDEFNNKVGYLYRMRECLCPPQHKAGRTCHGSRAGYSQCDVGGRIDISSSLLDYAKSFTNAYTIFGLFLLSWSLLNFAFALRAGISDGLALSQQILDYH